MRLSLLKDGDWAGIVTMAIGLVRVADRCSRKATKTTGSARCLSSGCRSSPWSSSTAFIVDRAEGRRSRWSICGCSRGATSASARSPMSSSASRCSARSISCRNISARCSATMPSRSARCWPGPACRSWSSSRSCRMLMKRLDVRYIAIDRDRAVRRQLFHEHAHVARLFGPTVPAPQHRARHRPGPGADAAVARSPRPASRRRTPPTPPACQHAAQPRRRDRHRGARRPSSSSASSSIPTSSASP